MCIRLVHGCLLSTYYVPDTIPAVEIKKEDVGVPTVAQW